MKNVIHVYKIQNVLNEIITIICDVEITFNVTKYITINFKENAEIRLMLGRATRNSVILNEFGVYRNQQKIDVILYLCRLR